MRVAVCIATYNRQDGLRLALEGVFGLQVPASLGVAASILVVDNSADGNARALVDGMRQSSPFPLAYVHQPRKGISAARNAALDNTHGIDFVAFLDDDEVPDPAWLAHLVEAQRRLDADVVCGPTLPRFVHPPTSWLLAGRFFEPVRHPDGAPVETAFAGNVLFRRAPVMQAGIRFDESIGLIGGEDVDFFDRLRRRGARLRYCDKAIAFETVPPHRARLGWLLRRWFRTGNSEAILYMDRHAGMLGRLVVVGKGAVRLCLGSAALMVIALVAWPWRMHWMVGRLYTVARGLGMIASALNIHYYEYAS